VAAFGLFAGTHGATPVSAQPIATESCTVPALGYVAGATFTCTDNINLGGNILRIDVPGSTGTNFTLNSVVATGVAGGCAPAVTTFGSPTAPIVSIACSVTGVGNFFTGATETWTVAAGVVAGASLTKTTTCGPNGAGAGAPGSCGPDGPLCTTLIVCQAGNQVGPVAQTAITATVCPVGGTTGVGSTVVGGGCAPAGVLDPNRPTGEDKTCTNVGSINGVIPGATSTFVSNTTSFTIPLFTNTPTLCAVRLLDTNHAGGTCGATAASATGTCTDGGVIVSLTTPGSPAVLSCPLNGSVTTVGPTSGVVTGLSVSGSTSGAACQIQTGGTSLFLPCGNTSNPLVGTANVCSGVAFQIQSLLSGCINTPVSNPSCPLGSNAFQFTGGSATVTLTWVANAAVALAGVNGGLLLGTNTFTFPAPGVGILLVTATPQLIPSNGTLASIVTATFSCGSVGLQFGFNGFPISGLGITTATGISSIGNIANQPILGPGPQSGTSAVCGAGLPGNFTFSSPGEVLFDNGRQTESVGCGLNGQQNIFGGANPFNPTNINPTLPLVFTCTGAAVLAIGGGAAGDAPINVTYQSSVGGLTAVGSTLITVAPSGVPRISIQCNPSTIASGNTGSLCTATVTDVNGIPLTGITGSTVTFTVSDPSEASILPCVVNIPGTINITTSPNVIPQVTPNTPCLTPSGTIPGQANTFLNGQATALLVASSYAHPETVTVTASLGVLIPPSFACLVSPYVPSAGFSTIPGIFGGIFTGNTATSGVGLPSVSGCGLGNPIGFTGLASGLSVAGSGSLGGIVTLPNTTSASTTVNIGGVAGILISGATITSPLQLSRGCNQVIVTSTIGTPIANIAALVSPSSAVISIWLFSNSTKQWQAGFFSDPGAPTDFIATQSIGSTSGAVTAIANGASTAGNAQVTQTFFICVNQAATIISG